MALNYKLLFGVVVLLQSGCAALGGVGSAGSAGPQYEGIKTRAIGSAPATQPANNPSRPLSQQNTPSAVAAREAAARRSRELSATATVTPTAANPGPGISLATSPSQSQTLQKGSKVRVRSGTALHAQPNMASQTAAITQDAELELGPQIYNAGGYWWYVTAGKESGWLLQADIAR